LGPEVPLGKKVSTLLEIKFQSSSQIWKISAIFKGVPFKNLKAL